MINIAMNKLLIYWFKKISPKERTKFNRKLYGYSDTSNFGSYTYKRKGLLKDYKKITKGVILLSKIPRKAKDLLKENKASFKIFKISS